MPGNEAGECVTSRPCANRNTHALILINTPAHNAVCVVARSTRNIVNNVMIRMYPLRTSRVRYGETAHVMIEYDAK